VYQFDLFLILFAIISFVAVVFKNTSVPLSLYFLVTGMLLSLIPWLPQMSFNPNLVLDVFLPLLIYDMTSQTGWRDVKFNLRPIILLSIGHVLFITVLVACVIHWILPELGWPIAFIIGAVVSPPDDAAIMPLVDKGYLPQRLVTILKCEALFNDSMALILFKFSLIALMTHEFSLLSATADFGLIVVGETLYGVILGYTLGYVRTRIHEPRIQMITSFLSPFIAYLPSVRYGGCGVLATAIMGLVIRHRFLQEFSPEARLVSQSVWGSLSFAIESILFLLIGLDLRFILDGIASIPFSDLMQYALVVIGTVVLGRFVWVFATILRNRPPTPWEYCLVVSWAGMRGAISLAAVLAVPHLDLTIYGANVRDLIIFLVFCVILTTLLFQGLSLPWLVKKFAITKFQQAENRESALMEWKARLNLTKAVLEWLKAYKQTLPPNHPQYPEVIFYLRKYQITLQQYEDNIKVLDEPNKEGMLLGNKILEIEQSELTRMWDQDEISYAVRNKLLQEMDYRSKA
jgi:Na+/H+ antiporter